MTVIKDNAYPPQLKTFLTLVVLMIFFLLKKSASCPPKGTIIVITRWGRAASVDPSVRSMLNTSLKYLGWVIRSR